MKLVSPSVEYEDSFLEALEEFKNDPDLQAGRYEAFEKLSVEEIEEDFKKFVVALESRARGENLPVGYVPETVYWLIDESKKFVGQTSVRHRLNDHLNHVGGHIGYGIRPSRRRQGYGTMILGFAIEEARLMGVDKILVTVDESNIGSQKVIEKNGGVLENKVMNPETRELKRRYWINSEA